MKSRKSKSSKTYLTKDKAHSKTLEVNEPVVAYGLRRPQGNLELIDELLKGMKFNGFKKIVEHSPFNLNEWAGLVGLSLRTLQRYQEQNKKFDVVYSEKILEVANILARGAEIFGTQQKFNQWLHASNIVLGNVQPVELLTNTFGINILQDELTRIEHGVLA